MVFRVGPRPAGRRATPGEIARAFVLSVVDAAVAVISTADATAADAVIISEAETRPLARASTLFIKRR